MGSRSYRLTVEGELGEHMEPAFPGMMLSRDHCTTTLTGESTIKRSCNPCCAG